MSPDRNRQAAEQEIKMKQFYEIWKQYRESEGMLVPVSEISDMINAYGFNLYKIRIPGVTTYDEANAKCEELNSQFAQWKDENYGSVTDFMDETDIVYEDAGDSYTVDDFDISYNDTDNAFLPSGYDTVSVYEYWVGSDLKQMERPDDYDEFEYDPDLETSLDTWNGSDFNNGSVGRHTDMATLDDGRILMIYRSQHEGEQTTAEIITAEEYAVLDK